MRAHARLHVRPGHCRRGREHDARENPRRRAAMVARGVGVFALAETPSRYEMFAAGGNRSIPRRAP